MNTVTACMLIVIMQDMSSFISTDCSCQDMYYKCCVVPGPGGVWRRRASGQPASGPEAKVAVPTDWLATILTRHHSEEPKLVVKKMLDGFLTPWDLGKAGGTSALDTKWEPLIRLWNVSYFLY